jgi:class 3 adenylate cyclase
VTETEPHARTRTLVASFLFTDLVGFSIGSAAEQTAAKATLSAIIRSNIAALRETDYRIRDTGDGALIAFVTDPEHALYMALAIAQDFGRAAAVAGFPSNSLRTGLHLGAVKEVIDVEARPNYIGDGINAAKRIMDFAAPGQITASRAFFDAVAGLDAAFGALFRHVGAPDDKHGRAHELYTVEPSDTVLERLKQELAAAARDSAAAAGKSPAPIKVRLWSAPAMAADGQVRSSRAGEIARKLIIPVISVAAIGIAIMVVAAKLRESNGPDVPAAGAAQSGSTAVSGGRTAAGEPAVPGASPAASKPASATSTSAEAPPADSRPASAVQPKPEATPPPSARVAADAPTPDSPKPATAPAGAAAKSNVAMKPKSDAAPAAPVPATAAPERNNARCSRIMEKATLGEALSTEEKKELASSCR